MRNNIIAEDIKFITDSVPNWNLFRDKTILISGSTGFLASYLVDTLLHLNATQEMNIKIIGLIRKPFLQPINFYLSNYVLFEQDICNEIKIDEPIDYIIHSASQSTPKVFGTDPVGTILPNVVGTNNLLKLAVEKKVKGFLFFSTSGVYGDIDRSNALTEKDFGGIDPTDLSSCYLESKKMGENLCIAYMHQYGVPIKIVRPSISYGPRIKLDDGRSYADFISSIVNKKNIILTSDGKALRNFCYVADTIVGIFLVMLFGKVGEAYNVATDKEISIIDLANFLVKEVFPELNLKVVINKKYTNYLRSEFLRTQMDITKIKKLGWEINFSLKEGFKRTIDSYKLG